MYRHALEIYENKQWFKVQDHINFMMSRLNYSLRNVPDALKHVNSIVSKRVVTVAAVLASHYYQQLQQQQQQQQPTPHHHHHHHHSTVKHSQHHYNLVEFGNEFNILRDFILYSNTANRAIAGGDGQATLVCVPIVDLASIEINLNPSDESALKYGNVLVNMENSAEIVHSSNNCGDTKSVKR